MSLVSKAAATVEDDRLTIEQYVVKQLGREVFEDVKCQKLYGDRYRVNWTNRQTHRITRSRFLIIRKVKDGFQLQN